MKFYLDIAASYYTESLTLIIGTGFSKWITNGKAPNWLELIIYCIDKIDPSLKDTFLRKENNKYIIGDVPLTIIAQLLEIEAKKRGLKLKDIACECIRVSTIDSNIDNEKIEMFKEILKDEKRLNIITTNYDTILSDYIFKSKCRIFTEGTVFSKLSLGIDIFHIHGIIKNPSSLILTQNDYYNLQIKNNYFLRKLYTLIHENTIGILGYSLNDPDINYIINEANTQKTKNFHNGDIFYITKDNVNDKLKEFYKFSLNIEVIEDTTFEKFITRFNLQKKKAIDMLNNFSNIDSILTGKGTFDEDYLKTRDSFYQIIRHIILTGLSILDSHVYTILLFVLQKKQELCGENSAWEQYDHLSDWLIELLTIVEINENQHKELKNIILFSLNTCSSEKYIGFSWDAYKNWDNRWKNMLYKNQIYIKELIESEFSESDYLGRRLLIINNMEIPNDPQNF